MVVMSAALKKVSGKVAGSTAAKTANVVQLRIELRWIRPKVWRRVLVPSSITLAKLHRVIQAAMGWTNSHLHEFVIGQQRYGEPDPDWDTDGAVISERKATLQAALLGHKSARYIYDFGDHWEHEVKLEVPLAKHAGLKVPICVDGKNACPPEDCGGPPGYAEFLRAVADPAHPEYDEMIEWAGRSWDATAFNIDLANREINSLR